MNMHFSLNYFPKIYSLFKRKYDIFRPLLASAGLNWLTRTPNMHDEIWKKEWRPELSLEWGGWMNSKVFRLLKWQVFRNDSGIERSTRSCRLWSDSHFSFKCFNIIQDLPSCIVYNIWHHKYCLQFLSIWYKRSTTIELIYIVYISVGTVIDYNR